MKKLFFAIVVLAVVTVAAMVIAQFKSGPVVTAADELNTTYVVGGKPVTLVNGVAEESAAPGSASKVVTRYFGNSVKRDLDNDGREDVVGLLTQQTGGSGVFYYLVAAINTPTGYVGSQAMFIGDRIAPQATMVDADGTISVSYADRLSGEPFSTLPSQVEALHVRYRPATRDFNEVVQNFEGGTVGGERDQHGCLTSAGYSFDAEIGACVHAWELTSDITKAAKLAVQDVGRGYALTLVKFNSYEEPGSYDIFFERGLERTSEKVVINNWQATRVR